MRLSRVFGPGLALAIALGASTIQAQETASTSEAEARARLVPQREAVLSSNMEGRIVSVAVRRGERFDKDAVLVKLDCAEIAARLDGAGAVSKGAERVVQVRKKLVAFGSVSDLDVALADADAARARADLALFRAQIAKCEVRAPFAGRVVERYAHPAETVVGGQKLLAVLDDRALEVEVLVPSTWLRWLKEGDKFELTVDETGRTYRAKVRRLGARIDAVSQSLPVIGDLVEPADGLLAGMSGVARFHAGR